MLTQDATKRWLTDSYDYEPPHRGELRKGVILSKDAQGISMDIGLKRDGFVPRADLERLDEEAVSDLKTGPEVITCIVQPYDENGNLIFSLYAARQEKDWLQAQEMLETGEIWHGEVSGYNRAGLLVRFGHLRGFVPASQLTRQNRWRLTESERQAMFEEYTGQSLSLKVVDVDRDRDRLILSEQQAQRQLRQQNMNRLLNELVEGETRRGTVRQLCGFGAFVDLEGADGLIHKSELAWHRVRHPDEILRVGDEIDVYILYLDHDRQRIGLSLKHLQPNPWHIVQETYSADQLVQARVTSVVDFGAFVALNVGVEGLVHISELADPPPQKPHEMVRRGDELVLRILSIHPFRQRMGLSLKRVSAQEREAWLAQQIRKTVAADPVEQPDNQNDTE